MEKARKKGRKKLSEIKKVEGKKATNEDNEKNLRETCHDPPAFPLNH